jgi:hypothetical protein
MTLRNLRPLRRDRCEHEGRREGRDEFERRLQAALTRASLDAPRADLWPRLEAEVAALSASRARRQRRDAALRHLRALAAAVLSLALAVALIGGLWAMLETRSASGPTAGAVPDTLLVAQGAGGHAGPTGLAAYRAGSSSPSRVLDGAMGPPAISPDGRQLFAVQEEIAGNGGARAALVALDSASLERRWSAPLAGDVTRSPLTAFGTAVAADRVYVALQQHATTEPITLVALDRADGRERRRWSVSLDGRALNDVELFAAPDGKSLSLVATVMGAAPQAIVRFRLPDGQEVYRRLAITPQDPSIRFAQESRFTPDGRALYQLSRRDNGARLAIDFLDLAQGTVGAPLDLPFRYGPEGNAVSFEQAASHDGRTLYVLAPALGQLAIVDLAGRRVVEVVELDRGSYAAARPSADARLWGLVRGLVVQDVAAAMFFEGRMQLSPDGSRLYAIGMIGQAPEARPFGVWVIDTASWRVVERWLPGIAPRKVLLSQDGRTLYVQHSPEEVGGNYGLRALDTGTGHEIFATNEAVTAVYTLADLYRERYGKSPGR